MEQIAPVWSVIGASCVHFKTETTRAFIQFPRKRGVSVLIELSLLAYRVSFLRPIVPFNPICLSQLGVLQHLTHPGNRYPVETLALPPLNQSQSDSQGALASSPSIKNKRKDRRQEWLHERRKTYPSKTEYHTPRKGYYSDFPTRASWSTASATECRPRRSNPQAAAASRRCCTRAATTTIGPTAARHSSPRRGKRRSSPRQAGPGDWRGRGRRRRTRLARYSL